MVCFGCMIQDVLFHIYACVEKDYHFPKCDLCLIRNNIPENLWMMMTMATMRMMPLMIVIFQLKDRSGTHMLVLYFSYCFSHVFIPECVDYWI